MKINTSQISMDASAEHKDVTGRFTQRAVDTREGEPEFRLNLAGMSGFRRERVEENRQAQECTATSTVHCPDGERNAILHDTVRVFSCRYSGKICPCLITYPHQDDLFSVPVFTKLSH